MKRDDLSEHKFIADVNNLSQKMGQAILNGLHDADIQFPESDEEFPVFISSLRTALDGVFSGVCSSYEISPEEPEIIPEEEVREALEIMELERKFPDVDDCQGV